MTLASVAVAAGVGGSLQIYSIFLLNDEVGRGTEVTLAGSKLA
jgi:hypothetical protein